MRTLLPLLILQATTILAHHLTKRRGGGGGGGGRSSGGGGGGGSSLSTGSSASWKVVLAVLGSVIGTFLLLYLIFWECAPGGRIYEWVMRVRDERLARKWAKHDAEDANTNANGRWVGGGGGGGGAERGTMYAVA